MSFLFIDIRCNLLLMHWYLVSETLTFVIFASYLVSVTFVIFAWYFLWHLWYFLWHFLWHLWYLLGILSVLSILHWRFVFASRRSIFNISRGGELIEERPKSENTNHSPCLRMTASYHDCLILIDQKQLKMGDTYPSLSEWLITLYYGNWSYGNWVLPNLVALVFTPGSRWVAVSN